MCMYVCMSVCVSRSVRVCMYVCACMHARTYVVHTHVRIYVLYTYLQARKDGRVDLLAEVSVIGENEAPPRSTQHLCPCVCVHIYRHRYADAHIQAYMCIGIYRYTYMRPPQGPRSTWRRCT